MNDVTREEFKKLDHQVNGNGQPGLVQLVQGIKESISGMEAKEEARNEQDEKHHRANVLRLNIIIAFTGIAALIVSIAAILVTVSLSRNADLKWPTIFQVDTKPITVEAKERNAEDATIYPSQP